MSAQSAFQPQIYSPLVDESEIINIKLHEITAKDKIKEDRIEYTLQGTLVASKFERHILHKL